MPAILPAADVVAGGQRVGAELVGRLQQVGELDGLVAGNAGDRRLAGDVAFGERVDHRLAEALFVVEHEMGDAEGFRNAPGVVDVLAGAAGAGAMDRGAVVVKLQGHADDVISLPLQDARHDRRIHAARHRDDDAGALRAAGKVQAVHRLDCLSCGSGFNARGHHIGQASACCHVAARHRTGREAIKSLGEILMRRSPSLPTHYHAFRQFLKLWR